jgi:thiamine-monophosphate kinase
VLLVTGTLGGSIAGQHFDFTPRVREALLLHERYELHAGMDISDGLALDLSRLATACGCGAVLQADRVPFSDAVCNTDKPLDRALSDGEDFELLLAVPTDAAAAILREQPLGSPVTRVGSLVAERGLLLETDGRRLTLEPKGWQH